MEENKACPECGSALIKRKMGCALTYKCHKCGWSVATTEFDPIDLDETSYEIRLLGNDAATKERMSFLAKLTGRNFLECKRLIENGGIVFSGSARQVAAKKAELLPFGFHYAIHPDFPY